ncbi:hypothetical protein Hypma_001547 [Hypsizygus marmoreus]|uniref:Uncharacterized protein n=1 Tax=Hypsizygus marmoreus TaxID=39966 RepID=A0A369K8I1_HYPMA|nr:hypothetical protein Hypma_001547 [Hypsizygus marmoreus]
MVQCVIEHSPIWQGNDWVAACTYLLGLYSLNVETQVLSAECLRLWTEKHEALQKKIWKKIPAVTQTTSNPPSVADMLTWLCAEFNGIDIDTVLDDVNLEVETSSNDSSDDSDIDKKSKTKKKKVSFKVPTEKTVPAAPIIDPIESITKHLDELTISTQELLRISNQGRQNFNTMNNTGYDHPYLPDHERPNFPNVNRNDRRCFFCHQTSHGS